MCYSTVGVLSHCCCASHIQLLVCYLTVGMRSDIQQLFCCPNVGELLHNQLFVYCLTVSMLSHCWCVITLFVCCPLFLCCTLYCWCDVPHWTLCVLFHWWSAIPHSLVGMLSHCWCASYCKRTQDWWRLQHKPPGRERANQNGQWEWFAMDREIRTDVNSTPMSGMISGPVCTGMLLSGGATRPCKSSGIRKHHCRECAGKQWKQSRILLSCFDWMDIWSHLLRQILSCRLAPLALPLMTYRVLHKHLTMIPV